MPFGQLLSGRRCHFARHAPRHVTATTCTITRSQRPARRFLLRSCLPLARGPSAVGRARSRQLLCRFFDCGRRAEMSHRDGPTVTGAGLQAPGHVVAFVAPALPAPRHGPASAGAGQGFGTGMGWPQEHFPLGRLARRTPARNETVMARAASCACARQPSTTPGLVWWVCTAGGHSPP